MTKIRCQKLIICPILFFIILLFFMSNAVSQTARIVAHRGASKDAPENTIAAFNLAWKQNADAIEGDFFLTKDGHIVCTHDKSTKRFNKVDLVVKDSTLAELQKLDVGSWHDKKFAGTIMPTIADVFATVPKGKIIYVEIKCGVEIIESLMAEIKKSKLKLDQIVVICFDENVIAKIKKVEPRLVANWLLKFELDSNQKLSPSVESAIKTLKSIKANGIGTSHENVNKAMVTQIISAGFDYHAWTVDEPKVARQFAKWGAKSITTNVPAVVRKGVGTSK